MKLEELLNSAAGPGIVRRALQILGRVQKLQSTDTRKTEDAAATPPKDTAFLKSAAYAAQVNEAGAKMRRQQKDCRSGLRRSAVDAEPEIVGPSLEQKLNALRASEDYAKECRERWRKY